MSDQAFNAQYLQPSWEVRAKLSPSRESAGTVLGTDNLDDPRNILMGWLIRRFGNSITQKLASGKAFFYDDGGKHYLDVVTGENAWGFRASYPDDQGRSQVTEVSLRRRSATDPVELHVTQGAVLSKGETYAPTDFPGFMRSIAAENILSDSGSRLVSSLSTVNNLAQAERLLRQIKNAARKQPMIVFVRPDILADQRVNRTSQRIEESISHDAIFRKDAIPVAKTIAGTLSGIVHVVVVNAEMSVFNLFARTTGTGRLVPGTIHVYQPADDSGGAYTLLDAAERPSGWAGFGSLLSTVVARTSCRTAAVGPFKALRASIGQTVERRTYSNDEIFEILVGIDKIVDETLSSATQGILSPLKAAEKLRECATELSSYRDAITGSDWASSFDVVMEHAEDNYFKFKAAAYKLTKPHVRRYQDIPEWIQTHFGEQIVLAPSLIKTLSETLPSGQPPFHSDILMVLAGLELLGTHGFNRRFAGGKSAVIAGRRFEQRLVELGFRNASSLGTRGTSENVRRHTVKVEDDGILLNRLLVNGTSADHKDNCHIYFAEAPQKDQSQSRIVVGHFTSHL